MTRKIKAIIFDAGRVLVNFNSSMFFGGLTPFSKYSEEEIETKLRGGGLLLKYHDGLLDAREFYKKSIAEIDASGLDLEIFCNLWNAIITGPNEEIEKVLQLIRPEIKLLILSDTSEPHWELFKEFPAIKKFFPDKNNAVLSFEVHASKPAEKIYEEAVRRAGCPIEECVFIDDNKGNVEQFRILGGNGVDYDCRTNSTEELKNELSPFGVLG